ncbi:MAG: DUF364 domain-containing protein [Calditrichaceae bacterium]|jgi:uncharacterized protein
MTQVNMFKIKEDLLNSVNAGDIYPEEVNVGAHLISIQSRYCGIASTLSDNHGPHKIVEEAGRLETLSLKQLIQFLQSNVLLKASIGLAALNSLIDPPDSYMTGNAFDFIKSKAKNKNLGIIGHFHFVNRFKDITKNCWVFEKSPREDDLPEDKISEYLPECDIVVITGQTIINNTLAEILKYSKMAFNILLGPSVPMSNVLFDYGIDLLAGVKVLDFEPVNRSIRQGANFRQLKGVKLLMMSR